jgi:hypothetical protein
VSILTFLHFAGLLTFSPHFVFLLITFPSTTSTTFSSLKAVSTFIASKIATGTLSAHLPYLHTIKSTASRFFAVTTPLRSKKRASSSVATFFSNVNMLSILLLLLIWRLSPVSIAIASGLLGLNLLGALIVKVTANPVEMHSIPASLISPAFSHLRLNMICSYFDALHLAEIASLAQKYTELKIRESIFTIKESVLHHCEHALKLQLDDLSQRQCALYEAEKRMKQWEEDFAFRTGAVMFQQARAQEILAADGRKKMKEIWDMTPPNQRRIRDRTAKQERMRGVIAGWSFRKADVEKGDLRTIREQHECTRMYKSGVNLVSVEAEKICLSNAVPAVEAAPPGPRPPTPTLKKAVHIVDPPKSDIRENLESVLHSPQPTHPANIVFGSFPVSGAQAVISEPPRVIFKATTGARARE